MAMAVSLRGTLRLLVADFSLPTFTSRPGSACRPSLRQTSFTPRSRRKTRRSKSMSLLSRPSNSPVLSPVLSMRMYAAACWYLRLPLENVEKASLLNLAISVAVKTVTCSCSSTHSLSCAARKLAFFIMGTLCMGFFWMNPSSVR